MTARYLEDFTVGQTFSSGRLRIDAEQIKTFALRNALDDVDEDNVG